MFVLASTRSAPAAHLLRRFHGARSALRFGFLFSFGSTPFGQLPSFASNLVFRGRLLGGNKSPSGVSRERGRRQGVRHGEGAPREKGQGRRGGAERAQ